MIVNNRIQKSARKVGNAKQAMKISCSQKGFNLVELMATMAILALLGMLTYPTMQGWLARMEANEFSRQMARLITLGRTEATLYRQTYALCGGQGSCTGDWTQGAILFQDNGVRGAIDGTDRIVRQDSFGKRTKAIRWAGNLKLPYLILLSNGSVGSNGTMTYCGEQPAAHRQLVLSRSGRLRMSQDRDGDGQHEPLSANGFGCD